MKDTALLVIDMQNGFLNERSPLYIDGAAATVPACAEMIAFCRKQNVPVFFVTRIYAADGSDVEHTRYEAWAKGGKPLLPGCAKEISADMPVAFGEDKRDYHIIKPRYSAFFATGLDLLLAGTTTPNCIRTTCYDAISLDYAVTVLSDCTSSKTPEIQKSNLRDMANIGAVIASSKEIIEGSERA